MRGNPRRVLQAVVGDGTGSVNLKWFRGGDSPREHLSAQGRRGSS